MWKSCLSHRKNVNSKPQLFCHYNIFSIMKSFQQEEKENYKTDQICSTLQSQVVGILNYLSKRPEESSQISTVDNTVICSYIYLTKSLNKSDTLICEM